MHLGWLSRPIDGIYNAPVTNNDRLSKLHAMLQQQPNDPFLLYGTAMEYKKLDDAETAMTYLDRTLAADPNYCYAYYQKGLVKESTGDVDGAKAAYRAGIEAARRNGDEHARGELESALKLLE